MTNLLFSLLNLVIEASRAKFVRQTRQTAAVQEKFLLTLLRAYQNTALGRDFGLADIKTVDQFRERVPILPYSQYEPYIERVAQGEPNILTPDPVVYLNLTSGSTGKQKLVPVTKRSRQILQRAQQTSMGFGAAAARKRGLPIGRLLLTSSVQLLGRTSGGIEYGPVSVGNLRHSNLFYRQIFAQPFEALQATDSLTRHYLCLLFALRDREVSAIGANFPVLALRLCDYLECHGEDLIQDMESGTIAPWLKLEPELRVKLEKMWSADPKRAAELRQFLKAEGRLIPKSIWPKLSVVTTARGGTSNFYFERFPTYFGDTPIFGGIYASAEATFGVYHEFNNDGTILAIESGFFEFIPEDQWEFEQPKTLLAEEVTPGQYYRILVTNYNGLYRYDIGDVVEVLGFYEKAPVLVFRHRLGGLLSSTTEKTTEFHATQVMQLLQQEFNVPLENFCITLSDDVVPAPYLVNIELPAGHTLPDPKAFLSQFDHRLKEIHVSYEVKRRDQVPPPRLRILEQGSFAEVRQRLLRRGIPESQLKFPHISEDRKILSGLRVEKEVRLVEG
ncbi:MAG: GH3 auxin-responsive promoter family protein [Oculatellaceae cyanobacterium bins.114]|nr:GH3 auxin-responsive promoter family protein [Oculatellaceae cyanobacterium bins.114]